MVVGRPILLALEEIDGTPSFLEKALRFIEEFGKTLTVRITFMISGIVVLIFLTKEITGEFNFDVALRIQLNWSIFWEGIKVEGILRQSADVEEVEQRVHEYEQGRLWCNLATVLIFLVSHASLSFHSFASLYKVSFLSYELTSEALFVF